jgi:hypothetical protein
MQTCEEHDGCIVVYDNQSCGCPVCNEIDGLQEEIEVMNE